jgi:dihydrofolate reductase
VLERLRAEPGGEIAIGGATLAAEVAAAGLVHEYQAMVYTVLVGGGVPVFHWASAGWIGLVATGDAFRLIYGWKADEQRAEQQQHHPERDEDPAACSSVIARSTSWWPRS